jgi:2-polyprenyl-3-methyl-5-hydroxy-6-metoxy-1,4-benzoquinol methylase
MAIEESVRAAEQVDADRHTADRRGLAGGASAARRRFTTERTRGAGLAAVSYCSGVTRETEGETERDRRRYQQGLFDGVALLYEATRPGYPQELAEFVVATAGAPVLGVGCGTGQLTERLVPLRLALTAIDVGASMIEVARERMAGDGVVFQAEVGLTLGAAVTMALARRPVSCG